MLESILEGIIVLDLGPGTSVSFCSRLLADYGAEVIKVEPPGHGDPLRRSGPYANDDPHLEKSIPFLYLNSNKRGVTLDFSTRLGQEVLLKLADRADIIVEGFKPGFLDRIGLGHRDLEQLNPGIIVTSITPFGQTGPYRHFVSEDIVACAMSGLMYLSGDSDKEPLRNSLNQSDYVGGINAAGASLIALFHRMSMGLGQQIDVSIVECMAAHLVQAASAYTYMGAVRGRRSPQNSGLEEIMPCKDGFCLPSAQGSQPWETIAELVGIDGLNDPKFSTAEGRMENSEHLREILSEGLLEWDKKELFHASAERRLLFGMVQDAGDLFECPQLHSRDFYVTVNHPVIGEMAYPGEIVRLSEGSFQARRSAPLLGEHNIEVYEQLVGMSNKDLVRYRQLDVI
ncbi:CoA transferase [SAR202 cluster bacterium AD-804-J14_MRT_500m]|nr:CoA transferase [SAR202 cluster bacterium AD-804-J14_MRT_500m]